MEALSGSCLKFFTSSQKEKERAVWCSREIAFLAHKKRVRNGFCLDPKFAPSISAVSSSQTNVETEEIQTNSSDEPKTVHVRFKLSKACAFGEQFLVVGDDPVLGLWDPLNGVALNWSEGHVWIAEVDIPIGKVIKYKFVLKGISESIISWQPGPDRILETWETEKIVSVSEDWENPELQSIVEEDFVDESLIDLDLLMVAENLDEIKELEDSSDEMKGLDNENDLIMIAENISEGLEEQDLSSSYENESNLSSFEGETRLCLDEGLPVLVPGLVATPMDEIEADNVENNVGEDTTINSELEDEIAPTSQHSTETSEVMTDEEQLNGNETITWVKDRIVPTLETDMRWGRRTLQRFLANLGFYIA